MEIEKKIGRHKVNDILYRMRNNMRITDEETQQIQRHKAAASENSEAIKDYFKKITEPQKPIKILSRNLCYATLHHFEKIEKKKLELTPQVKIFIQSLAWYFSREKKGAFLETSEFSFDKGLCLLGAYGTGKSSIMAAFARSLYGTPEHFKITTAKKMVEDYETADKNSDKKAFYDKYIHGKLFIDDLFKEGVAKNYGSKEIIEHVLDRRESEKLVTHISFNATNKDATDKILSRYGSSLYDRSFSMFNFIEANWASYRR